MRLKRWFREGELLWCYLDPPIRSGKGDNVAITFWPGLVEEVKLKTAAVPRAVGDAQKRNGNEVNGDGGGHDQDDEPMPWTVRQSTLYKMRLLAVSHSYTIPDEKVLPYQAYAPPNDLIVAIQAFTLGNLNINAETLAEFNPCPLVLPDANGASGSAQTLINGAKFADAIAPYSLAVQIAAKLAGYWSLTDDWDFKYTVSPNGGATNVLSAPTPTHATGSSSAGTLPNPEGTMSFGMRQISGVSRSVPEYDLQNLGMRMLGPAPLLAQTLSQTRYQGLWWGAERIWTDELVRLKLARKQVAPEGAPNIYAPAGPSKKTLEYNAKLLPEPEVTEADLGAGGRGLFMRLEGLFVVDIPREDDMGTRKECRASGMLYELVDEDWQDPFEEAHKTFAEKKEKQRLAELNISTSTVDGTSGSGNEVPSASSSKQATPREQFSHPISAPPYPLPRPPTGFKFRPILSPGHESVVSLTLISGRYYPGILLHPLLQPAVRQAYANPLEDGGLHQANHLWALEGLSPGYFNAVDPSKVKNSRIAMMRDADSEARLEVEEACAAAREMKMQEVGDVPMQEVDELGGMDIDGA